MQSGGEVRKDTGKNVLRAAINPLGSMKQSIELPGARARVQSHQTRPEIYVDVDTNDDTPAGSKPVDPAHRFRLLRLQSKKDSRVVGNLKIAMTGKVSQQESFIEMLAEPFSGDWVKVTPTRELEPGEYALAEMLGEKQINLYVWDFGVDPSAPANPGAWKPVQPPPSKTGRTNRRRWGQGRSSISDRHFGCCFIMSLDGECVLGIRRRSDSIASSSGDALTIGVT